MTTSYFWTDIEQATERLNNCVVQYDSLPVYIERIERHEDGIPRAKIYPTTSTGAKEISRKRLDSPKFKQFRDLPRLGWFNPEGELISFGATFLARMAATQRIHGLNDQNVRVSTFDTRTNRPVGGNYRFMNVVFNDGFMAAAKNDFPPLQQVLQKIKEGTAIAVSPMWCVVRDTDGISWLYRDDTRVGIFTGADTINLLSKFRYLREEIMASPVLTVNTIREF